MIKYPQTFSKLSGEALWLSKLVHARVSARCAEHRDGILESSQLRPNLTECVAVGDMFSLLRFPLLQRCTGSTPRPASPTSQRCAVRHIGMLHCSMLQVGLSEMAAACSWA